MDRPFVIAQGAESLVGSVSSLFREFTIALSNQPWLLVAVGGLVLFIIIQRRR